MILFYTLIHRYIHTFLSQYLLAISSSVLSLYIYLCRLHGIFFSLSLFLFLFSLYFHLVSLPFVINRWLFLSLSIVSYFSLFLISIVSFSKSDISLLLAALPRLSTLSFSPPFLYFLAAPCIPFDLFPHASLARKNH